MLKIPLATTAECYRDIFPFVVVLEYFIYFKSLVFVFQWSLSIVANLELGTIPYPLVA